jgi:hypothetical protein
LGIEAPVSPILDSTDGGAGDGDVLDAPNDVVGVPDALPDAQGDVAESRDGGFDVTLLDANEVMVGVGCGAQLCTNGLSCCFDNDQKPRACSSPGGCANMGFLIYSLACDGPEDCNGTGICCVGITPSSGLYSGCFTECMGGSTEVCHPGQACSNGANCISAPAHCLGLSTCGSGCP